MNPEPFADSWDAVPAPVWGAGLGLLATLVCGPLMKYGLSICGAPPRRTPWSAAAAAGVLIGLFAWWTIAYRPQATPEVLPGVFWVRARVLYYWVLLVLLAATACTDWRTCFIPDAFIWPGVAFAVGLAWVSGDLQTAHVWVDWNHEIANVRGPYLPEWMRAHPHWHGLAWSLAGALAGAAATALLRGLSSWSLGTPALGVGDIWLMALIGAFLGWQPTLVILTLAPVLAVLLGLPIKWLTNRPYLPFGPFLAAAAYIVLCTWQFLWMFEIRFGVVPSGDDRRTSFAVRRLFGDPWMLLSIGGCVAAALVVLLGWRRLLALLPIGSQGRSSHGAS